MLTWFSVRNENLARKIRKVLFSPSDWDMVRIVDGRLLENITIECKNLVTSNEIFGPDLIALKGKTVSQKTPEVQVEIESVPVAIMSLYCQDTVASNILFVNRISFLISISLHLKFGAVERIKN